VYPAGGDHLSGMSVTRHLKLPTNTWDCSGWGLPRSRIAVGSWELLPPNFTLALRLDRFTIWLRETCFLGLALSLSKGGIISVALFGGEGSDEQTPRVVCSLQSVSPLPRLATGRCYLPPVSQGVLSGSYQTDASKELVASHGLSGVRPLGCCPDVPPPCRSLRSFAGAITR